MNVITPKESNRLIRIKAVQAQTGLSRSYIYHLSSQGQFPRSVSLVSGGSSRGWVESEIQTWVEQRIAARDLEA